MKTVTDVSTDGVQMEITVQYAQGMDDVMKLNVEIYPLPAYIRDELHNHIVKHVMKFLVKKEICSGQVETLSSFKEKTND